MKANERGIFGSKGDRAAKALIEGLLVWYCGANGLENMLKLQELHIGCE